MWEGSIIQCIEFIAIMTLLIWQCHPHIAEVVCGEPEEIANASYIIGGGITFNSVRVVECYPSFLITLPHMLMV